MNSISVISDLNTHMSHFLIKQRFAYYYSFFLQSTLHISMNLIRTILLPKVFPSILLTSQGFPDYQSRTSIIKVHRVYCKYSLASFYKFSHANLLNSLCILPQIAYSVLNPQVFGSIILILQGSKYLWSPQKRWILVFKQGYFLLFLNPPE